MTFKPNATSPILSLYCDALATSINQCRLTELEMSCLSSFSEVNTVSCAPQQTTAQYSKPSNDFYYALNKLDYKCLIVTDFK